MMGVQQQPAAAPLPVLASRDPHADEEQQQRQHRPTAAEVAARQQEEETKCGPCGAAFCTVVCSPGTWPQRIMCVLFWLAVIVAAVIIFAIILPRALADPMGKLIRMILARFTKAELKGIIIGAIALLPLTIVLPAQPFAWIAGMVFNFGTAFGLVMLGSFVGMTIQYWLARSVFHDRVERHLNKRRKDGVSVAIRAIDIAGPWKVLALVRLGPSPYATMNYVFGVVPSIKYYQYIIASTICIAHHRALQVFFGAAMPTLADLFSGKPVGNIGPAIYRFAVLALGIALCIVIVIMAKKALKKIELQELEREAQEAAAAQQAAVAAAAEEGAAGGAGGAGAAAFPLQSPSSIDSITGSKTPLPLAVNGKLAATGAVGAVGAVAGGSSPSGSSTGDLQVILVDDATAATNGTTTAASSSSMSRASTNSLIPTAQAPPLPPAALESEPSGSGPSRFSSISSIRGLLGSTFQRSS